MKKASAVDFFGVVRIVGYALALVAAMITALLFLAGMQWPVVRILAQGTVGPILAGLLLAWIAGLARVLVRRMRFESPQD